MQEVLSAPSLDLEIGIRYHELGYSVDAGIEIIVKAVQEDVYIITANADRYPAKVTLSGLVNFQKARVLKEDREMDIIENELTDHYRAFDVHIYHLTH